MIRPIGAYKLLVTLQNAHSPMVVLDSGTKAVTIPSIRKVARMLGTESKRVNVWLTWLEDHGYIENLGRSEDKRSVKFKLVRPPNI